MFESLKESIEQEAAERKAANEAVSSIVHQIRHALSKEIQDRAAREDVTNRSVKDVLEDVDMEKEKLNLALQRLERVEDLVSSSKRAFDKHQSSFQENLQHEREARDALEGLLQDQV